tara:strand:- start:594 stop:731 length:138 start_codon:yes stop_codon:yes gene_type:complete
MAWIIAKGRELCSRPFVNLLRGEKTWEVFVKPFEKFQFPKGVLVL